MVLAMTRPLDLVILMLGTNDIKRRFSLGPMDVSRAMEALINCVRTQPCGYVIGEPPKILVVAPVPVSQAAMEKEWGELFGQEGLELSRQIAPYYEKLASKMDCAFLDAGKYATANPTDGVHLDAENHKKLAYALLPVVRNILSDE